MRSEIACGIDAAMGAEYDVSKISPADVIRAIDRRTAEIDDAIAAAKANKLAHNAVNKARRDRLKALNDAVNQASADLQAEGASLLNKIDSLNSVGDIDANTKRVRQLREAGLSTDQINALIVPQAIDREATIEAARARIAEIGTLLPKCKEFWDDPWRRTDVLVGLGLDEEIAQYEACRVEPYEVPA